MMHDEHNPPPYGYSHPGAGEAYDSVPMTMELRAPDHPDVREADRAVHCAESDTAAPIPDDVLRKIVAGEYVPVAQYPQPNDVMRELLAARATIARVTELHKPQAVFGDCGHDHAAGDSGTMDVDGVGIVCAEAIMYSACISCCFDVNGDHTEECACSHKHAKSGPICPTAAALKGEAAA